MASAECGGQLALLLWYDHRFDGDCIDAALDARCCR